LNASEHFPSAWDFNTVFVHFRLRVASLNVKVFTTGNVFFVFFNAFPEMMTVFAIFSRSHSIFGLQNREDTIHCKIIFISLFSTPKDVELQYRLTK